MSPLRLKLAGLNGIDRNALRSMLRLSAELLSSEWILVEEGQADLEIFSFDTDAGQQAWRERGSGLTALLTNSGNITEPVDIVLRKPLHKSSFSQALNLVEEKLRQQQTATDAGQIDRPALKPAQPKWPGKLLSFIKRRKGPAAHLPSLAFQPPLEYSGSSDTIQDPALLETWLAQLPRDANQRAATLLKNMAPLGGLKLKPQQLLPLLEIYRGAIHDLLFTRDIAAVRRDLYITSENQRAIRHISELIYTLGNAYQQIARQRYQQGQTPDNNSLMLFCLNRSSEQLALTLLHGFQYYRTAPKHSWHWLHQQYLYQEQAGSLQQTVRLKQGPHSRSFYDLYIQIILTALADPYSLPHFDVYRLFSLMADFTDKVATGPLSPGLIERSSQFMLTGHFCIDMNSDQTPQPMVKTPSAVRQRPSSRLLNTQPALLYIENLFRDARTRPYVSLDAELRLLKRIIPQLNTTHERRQHRLDLGSHRQVRIVHGLAAVYQSLTADISNAIDWQLANQSSGGLMARRSTEDCYHLNIGDFVAIFEPGLAIKLASVRWLQVDTEGDTVIGLELIEGKPVPVLCTPDGEAEQHPALIIPAESDSAPSALVTEKGLYSPKRRLRVKAQEEPYLIVASAMIDSTVDYELFNFTRGHGS